jgi:plasmid stabilization system protein ParE
MGSSCLELGDSVRLFSHKRWVIIFRYQAHGIDVLRLADSSQDYLAWKL